MSNSVVWFYQEVERRNADATVEVLPIMPLRRTITFELLDRFAR